MQPVIVAEFEDTALLKVFASLAGGFAALPSVAVEEIERSYGLEAFAATDDCTERFFAISGERKIRHAGVRTVTREAKTRLFERGNGL